MKKNIFIFVIIFIFTISLYSLTFNENLKSYKGKEVQIYTINQNGQSTAYYFGTVVEVYDDFLVLNNIQMKSLISIKFDIIGVIAITEKNFNKN